jgi:inhibitor of cysteine peptidase
MEENNRSSVIALLLILCGILIVITTTVFLIGRTPIGFLIGSPKPSINEAASKIPFKKFKDVEEIQAYLRKASPTADSFVGAESRRQLDTPTAQFGFGTTTNSQAPNIPADRYSTTNTQVMGIDEPDTVKTDGNNIFSSITGYNYYDFGVRPLNGASESMIMPPQSISKTRIIKAFPVEGLNKIAEIDQTGDLLISGNILIILANQKILGYDVSNRSNPVKKWEQELKNNTQIQAARLYKDKIYLVANSYINIDKPCPIDIMSMSGTNTSIICTDIYRPDIYVESNSTNTIMQLNPQDGQIVAKNSFIASTSNTIIYMSENNLYSSYHQSIDYFDFMFKFFTERGRDLITDETFKRLEKVASYDISSQAKMVELTSILQSYYENGNSDEQLKKQNDLQNRMSQFVKDNKRAFGKTVIAKISLDSLITTHSTIIPGRILNQFSLDEYNGNIRVATTVGETVGFSSTDESANDLYVLDQNLNTIGSILDLGLEERIYSARFIGDRGYLVTFRQTDPFYILDLSNPNSPKMTGQLKIPGYSSYLHPLTNNTILGIGKEGANVKATLFDVQNPNNPTALDTYQLSEYNSDILQTHHAFLHDARHTMFFVPGDSGGYIFTYKNNKINLEKAVSDINPQRALFINDYLYIVAQDKIKVIDQNTWSEVKSLSF